MVQRLICLMLLGCGVVVMVWNREEKRSEQEQAQPFPSVVSESVQNVADPAQAFAFDLYREVAKQKGNVFFSPVSLSIALSMAQTGARHETLNQMQKVLHVSGDIEAWNQGMGGLSRYLNAKGPGYELRTANRIWGLEGYTFHPTFTQVLEEQFEAPLARLPFDKAPEPSRTTINQWVERQTQQKIRELLPQGAIDFDTRLVLTNAIYFKADWEQDFPKSATRSEDFFLQARESHRVPMMKVVDQFPFFENDEVQMLELPYQSGDLSMVLVLPTQRFGLADLESRLTATQFQAWRQQLRGASVNVNLPRFSIKGTFKLKNILSQLGMDLAFSNQADFSGMTSQEGLKIDDVYHQALVEVDEKGTVAAAATGIVMAPTSAVVAKELVFRADHPFLFAICQKSTGAILFLGRMSDPR